MRVTLLDFRLLLPTGPDDVIDFEYDLKKSDLFISDFVPTEYTGYMPQTNSISRIQKRALLVEPEDANNILVQRQQQLRNNESRENKTRTVLIQNVTTDTYYYVHTTFDNDERRTNPKVQPKIEAKTESSAKSRLENLEQHRLFELINITTTTMKPTTRRTTTTTGNFNFFCTVGQMSRFHRR